MFRRWSLITILSEIQKSFDVCWISIQFTQFLDRKMIWLSSLNYSRFVPVLKITAFHMKKSDLLLGSCPFQRVSRSQSFVTMTFFVSKIGSHQIKIKKRKHNRWSPPNPIPWWIILRFEFPFVWLIEGWRTVLVVVVGLCGVGLGLVWEVFRDLRHFERPLMDI